MEFDLTLFILFHVVVALVSVTYLEWTESKDNEEED
jgi:hypothetical protein